ncbi:unannotated protein [freshwater metagenome]|uniref:Unannotated protein n=1 Tax=freshwater metagenome TaxID=449393 RepID=A0A6J6DEK1_9ZZZZ
MGRGRTGSDSTSRVAPGEPGEPEVVDEPEVLEGPEGTDGTAEVPVGSVMTPEGIVTQLDCNPLSFSERW